MDNTNKTLMIYGANGYTGRLIVDYALECGLKPVVAGRNYDAIKQLAEEKQLPARIFDLDSTEKAANNLSDIDVVIHCAGPFSVTARPMMLACIASHTHYTDITGEISVFELAQKMSTAAHDADIVLCPGVGFDVIPSDCLASQLKEKMPDATHLALGFDSASKMSPGTAKTAVEGLGSGGKIRRDGKIIDVPLAFRERQIDFGNGLKHAVTIPWGDVSTAFYSTHIPNIEVYIPTSPRAAKRMRRLNWIRWLLALKPVQKILQKEVGKQARGPNAEQRAALKTYLWGEVSNAKGEKLCGRLQTANGYQLTYLGAIEVAKFLLNNQVSGGAYTPSTLINNRLVQQLVGSSEVQFESLAG